MSVEKDLRNGVAKILRRRHASISSIYSTVCFDAALVQNLLSIHNIGLVQRLKPL